MYSNTWHLWEGRTELSRRIYSLVRLLSILLVAAAGLQLPTRVVAGPGGNLSLQALALPARTFSRATMSGGPAGDGRADAASRLHTRSFFQLDRLGGYLQTATWIDTRRHPITLQILTSVFPGPGYADQAYGDARASLWESSRPVHPAGFHLPTFQLQERGGQVVIVSLLSLHTVEAEFSLRYRSGIDRATLRSTLAVLRRVEWLTQRRVAQFAPLPLRPYPQPPSRTITTAPWGTGPVIESPSLLVMGSQTVPAEAQLDPVIERGTLSRWLRQAVRHPTIAPPGALARAARTLSVGGGSVYDSAALYSNPAGAVSAFNRLRRANHEQSWLTSFLPALSSLPGADAAAWRLNHELVLAVRSQNVVLVLASTSITFLDLTLLGRGEVQAIPTWLHTEGTQIVDGYGRPFKLVGLNWYGAEENDFVPGGLMFRPYQELLDQIKALGYNSIRLPFSNQLVEQNPIVSQYLDANPELAGRHALDILDALITYAGAIGLRVILDDHRSEAGWGPEANGLWYTAQYPPASFVNDWRTVTERYAVNNVVIGADLRNEPHGVAAWGSGNPATDWRLAAEQAGDAVLALNPHLLVIVEGVQYEGSAPGYWWGGNLRGVATAPVNLQEANGSPAHQQLVYSAHDYGPDNCGAGCPWFNAAASYDSLRQIWEQYWGYIADDPAQPYAAPVWVGEFGTCNYQITCGLDSTPGSQGQWFSSLVRYLGEKNLGWAYWSLNGSESTAGTRVYGNLDWYGYFNQLWLSPYGWLDEMLRSIQDPSHDSAGPR